MENKRISNTHHVVLKNGKWVVVQEGTNAIESAFLSKGEAIDWAREAARPSGKNVVIHGKNGQAFRRVEGPFTFDEDNLRAAVRALAKSVATKKLDSRTKTHAKSQNGAGNQIKALNE